MPSGYTAKVGEGISFEEFVWTCARAFGALIMMRDDPLNAPVPQRFEPSDYHTKELERVREKLAAVEAMTDAEAERAATEEYDHACGHAFTSNRDRAALAVKYEAMITRVEEWTPPTPEHVGLKEFMLQQLNESLRFDCGYRTPEPVKQTGAEWRTGELERLRDRIAYHEKEHTEEVERTEGRNRWIEDLRKSVPPAVAQTSSSDSPT